MNIYVGNLSFNVTEADLKDLFSQHGAVQFLCMATIGIAAIHGKLGNVFKALVDPITRTEKAEFSHSGGINQHGALIENDELSTRRRMGAFSRSTDGFCVKSVLSDQAIDEGGLADPR